MLKPSKKNLNLAAEDMYASLASFLSNWGDFFDGKGGFQGDAAYDMMEWLADQVPYWKDAVAKAEGKNG